VRGFLVFTHMTTHETISHIRKNAAEALMKMLHHPEHVLVVGNLVNALPSPSNRESLGPFLHGLMGRMAYPAVEIANTYPQAGIYTYVGGPITPGEARFLQKLNPAGNHHLMIVVEDELVDLSTRDIDTIRQDFKSTPSQGNILRLSRLHEEQIPPSGRAILPFISVPSSEYYPIGDVVVGPDASRVALKHVMAISLREKQQQELIQEKVVAQGVVLEKEAIQIILDGHYDPDEINSLFDQLGDSLVLKGTDGVSGLSVGFLKKDEFVQDPANLQKLLHKILKERDGVRITEVLVDERINIAIDHMGDRKFNVRSIIDGNGNIIPYAVFRQLENGVKFVGEISAFDPQDLGLTPEEHRKLLRTHVEWAKTAYELGYSGPFSTDILSATDGTFVGVDPNPRYGGSSVLAVVQEWYYQTHPRSHFLLDRELTVAHSDESLLSCDEICTLDDRLRRLGLIPYATGLMKNGAMKLIVPATKEQIKQLQLTTHEGLTVYLNTLIGEGKIKLS